jgi:hypothetical protein
VAKGGFHRTKLPRIFLITVNLAEAIERRYDLDVHTTLVGEGSPHERLPKPSIRLACFDRFDEGPGPTNSAHELDSPARLPHTSRDSQFHPARRARRLKPTFLLS